MLINLYRKIVFKAYDMYAPIRERKSRKIMALKKKLGFNRIYEQNLISIEELQSSLESSGLKSNDTVFIRASLSAAQSIKGGVPAFLDGLKSYFSEGTIMMSSYTFDKSPIMYLATNPLFDPKTSLDRLNLVSEFFRRSPDVKRSIHPTHSVVVWGKDAHWFVKDHHKSSFCYDINSPFAKLYLRNAKELSFGVFPTSLSYHFIEQFVSQGYPTYRDFDTPVMCRVVVDGNEEILPFKVTDAFRAIHDRGDMIVGTDAEPQKHEISSHLDYYIFDLAPQLEALKEIIRNCGSYHYITNHFLDFVLKYIVEPLVLTAYYNKKNGKYYPVKEA
ncbi:AAC(3) family N-acetyltransferase [Maridesulfovibrio sp.]|uniref:AAC(3) family N-acetyltransferase n=1 Tax=Maridesulfovibrio sp. TaxID=2795000 RepID=UPI002A18B77B|nr:AAC(3) family N-acetyltransferase [Maridesulfovibrio sp.]